MSDIGADDQIFIDAIVRHARTIFRQPGLEFAPEVVFQDILGFDSVQAVQFILAMEETLGVTLDEEEVDRMHTMGDLMNVLRAKRNASAA
jgi:acyl carrier protein